ncbi:MAG: LptA/OstA family protein, partial [Pseudomonadota bacterium]|nr:LptA/OstA family protein [Pseudomonadota bacterium]
YEIGKKIITMGDNVTLTQNGNKLQGRKLIIDTLTGIGTLTADPQQSDSRVRGVFTPGQK